MVNITRKKAEVNKKAVLFARVSTARQKREGLSIEEIQLPRIREYAKKEGLEVIAEFTAGESGGSEKERKKFNEMVNFVEKNKEIGNIVVYRVDRATRNFKDAVRIKDLCDNRNVKLHCVDERLVLERDTRGSKMTEWNTKVFVGQEYLNRVKEDGFNTKYTKLERGELPWHAPFGYDNVKMPNGEPTVMMDGKNSHIVREIFRRYTTGTYSLQSLAKEINGEFDTNFYKNGIRRILTNKFYVGIIVDRRTGDEYPHIYDTLVSKDSFEKIQDILTGHSTKRQRYYGVEATYRAMMTCSECGCSLTPDPKKKVQKNGNVHHYLYYHCTNGKHLHTSPVHSISETKLDTIMQDLLKRLKPPKERMETLKKELIAKNKEKNKFYDERRASLTASLQRIRQRQEKAFDMLMDGSITQEQYDRNNERYAEEVEEVEKKQRQLDEIDQSYYVTVSYLLSLFEHASDIFAVAKANEKRQILGLLLSNLEFDGENIHYTLKEPFEGLFHSTNRSIWLGW
ncbi:recombinase family protein [Candidatus Saccharibacteria bacterium]|nr:recombinase family protein [Candidatus Saccharibacteria bacterium]